ncbi:MAG: hypothetical protein SO164_00440, partial [Campylobacter sp.]|nr:hypothetical protein [Campylobacter sp.]
RNSRIPKAKSKIPSINLEFLASVAVLPRNDAGNSRILYRDPPRGLGDDIVGNSRISRLKSLGILEFLS